MKKLFYFFTLLFIATTLNAQDTTDIKPKHEYAFVYIDFKADSLKIYFDEGEEINLAQIRNNDLGWGINVGSITTSFNKYIKAFNYLEKRGYEFMATGISTPSGYRSSVSYYIYRKKKQQLKEYI